MYARSGDIIFKTTTKKKLMDDYTATAQKDFVVAVGEATGHAHRVMGKVDVFGPKFGGVVRGIGIKKATKVTHEEHGAITLQPGFYEVGQERELDTRDQAYAVAD